MKKIKMGFIVLMFVLFFQCRSLQFDQNPPFKITSAVHQYWVGGQPGIKGVNIIIGYSSKKKIEFDSIFFDKRVANLQSKNSETETETLVVGYFIVNERKEMILDENPVKEFQNPIPIIKKFPFQLKEDEAVISYKIQGKIKYFKIVSVKKEKELNFPSLPK
ncbi:MULTISPECIES: hypothetical protein [unclassified Polaribacter]|uniref:hypothetical protein n=1 Tax=unclassified Polaribacter TaxID=196858 RepID=UPI0011BF0321|nr:MULTISPECIES: hypothetical protein [unclassified Polaribacter]TXD50580.1 hypothetical protein ES043_15410 [Polaribacter sp. IC063]TXD61731.1 hypothetical protein ES044_04395 [Polaribacter sp. IC066]